MGKIKVKYILLLILFCYFFFIFGNGIISLTTPDEVFYTQTAKEMVQQKTWITPYLFGQPQFEKPVLLYWLMRLSFIFLGINSFSARLSPALFGLIGVLAVYLLCLIGFKNEKKAFLSALVLMSSGLYIGLARTVFTDMIFSIFILLALTAFFWAYSAPGRKSTGIILYFIFSGLAVLSKGPLGIIITLAVVILFLFIRKDLKFFFCKAAFWGMLIFSAISLPWYILMIEKYGNSYIQEFFYNDHIRRLLEAEHIAADTWYFYPATMLYAMFPWSFYVLFSLIFLFKNFRRNSEPFYTFLICWIAAVFLIFQPAHSKLSSYIFPMFPALAIAAGDFIYNAITADRQKFWFLLSSITTAIFLFIASIGIIAASFIFKTYIAQYAASKLPIYILFASVFSITLLFIIFCLRRSFLRSVYALALFIPAVLVVIPFGVRQAEPYLSPKEACEYLLNNYKVENTILCAKFFVRGVKYYTDKDVAVVDIPGKGFFSPHPIPFLNTDEEVNDYLKKQKITYCIFKKSQLQDIERISQNYKFKFELLKQVGNEYILKVQTAQ